MSITPKLHTLLSYAIDQLVQTQGFTDMKEDAIERWHQRRFRKECQLIRLRNEDMIKRVQAKNENALMMAPVVNIQVQVKSETIRNLKRTESLAAERNAMKKARREEQRSDAFTSIDSQDMEQKLLKPRAIVLKGLKRQIQEEEGKNE